MSSLRALAIEASDQQRQILASQLKQAGIEHIRFVATAHAALDHLCRQPVDLLLTDLRLADMRGFAFIRRLANLPQPPAVAILTAHPGMLLDSKCMQARLYGLNIVAQLAKPAQTSDIARIASRISPDIALQRTTTADAYPFRRDELLTAIQCGEIRPQAAPPASAAADLALHGEWHHAQLGVLKASQFMPAIELNGLQDILRLTILNKLKPRCDPAMQQGPDSPRSQVRRPQPWAGNPCIHGVVQAMQT